MAAHAAVMITRRRRSSEEGHHNGSGGAGVFHARRNSNPSLAVKASLSPEDARRYKINEARASIVRHTNFRTSKVFNLSDEEDRRQHSALRIQLFARAHCIPSYGKRLHRENLFTRLQYEGMLTFGAWRLFIQVPMRVLCLNFLGFTWLKRGLIRLMVANVM
jgi:hypothetical protein